MALSGNVSIAYRVVGRPRHDQGCMAKSSLVLCSVDERELSMWESNVLDNISSKINLRFEDLSFERAFQAERYKSTTKFIANAIGFSALLWGAFGIWDASQTVEGAEQTRFRFMVAIPTLLGFFALTFTRLFRDWQHAFLWAYSATASLLCAKQLLEYKSGHPYFLGTGSAALNYALILVFVIGFFPTSVGWSFVLGVTVILIYGMCTWLLTDLEVTVLISYAFNLACIFGILVFMSYWRERFARHEFARQAIEQREKDKLSSFLSSYIPLSFVDDPSGHKSDAESFGEVTLLFADLVGFTSLTENLAPKHVLEILDLIFSAFDEAADQNGVEKVKTIGDAYMAISGKSGRDANHAKAMVDFAFAIIDIVTRTSEKMGYPLRIRVGIHTGSTIGGVIGRNKVIYDYWGRTVNLASRLEATGAPNKVHISEATYWRVRDFYKFEERTDLEVRGIGIMRTFFVEN
jgi:adenylate cyclase